MSSVSAASASQAQVQLELSVKFAKSNATAEQSVVQRLESANSNLQQVVNSATSSGIGSSLDIRA